MRTRTEAEQARRIFYSQADPEQVVRGYARIHNRARRKLREQPTCHRLDKLNPAGIRLLEMVAWAAYLEGWSK